MIYHILWTDAARQDLREIIDYIAHDSLDNALNILDRLEEQAETLTTFPDRGRVVAELADSGISQYREIISSPWRIIYRIESNQVFIMAVLDSRRNLQLLLLNRLVR